MNPATPLPRRRWLLPTLLLLCALALAGVGRAAEVIPAKPTRYFNDYALTVKPETADKLNKQLEDLEKESTNQVLVCIYPKMQTDSDVADFCQRIYRTWGVGGKDKNRGAILFVFLENHKLWIQTGYGLEGALPDATCKQITADVIAPRFKANDYDGGLTAGVDAIIKATKGEYKGDGLTNYQRTHQGKAGDDGNTTLGTIIIILVLLFIIFSAFRKRGSSGLGGGTSYSSGPIIYGGGFGSGGGSFGGSSSSDSGSSSSSSDSGGFFSSDGGSSGGGGAGSDW